MSSTIRIIIALVFLLVVSFAFYKQCTPKESLNVDDDSWQAKHATNGNTQPTSSQDAQAVPAATPVGTANQREGAATYSAQAAATPSSIGSVHPSTSVIENQARAKNQARADEIVVPVPEAVAQATPPQPRASPRIRNFNTIKSGALAKSRERRPPTTAARGMVVDDFVRGKNFKVNGRVWANEQRLAGQLDERAAVASPATGGARAAQESADAAIAGGSYTSERISSLDDYEPQSTAAVTFKGNSAALSDEAKAKLDELATRAMNTKGYVIELSGYTSGYADDSGSVEKNRILSQHRADTVIRYLVENHQIPLRRIVTPYDYGKPNPVADNATREGRAQNRRVEVTLLVNKGLTAPRSGYPDVAAVSESNEKLAARRELAQSLFDAGELDKAYSAYLGILNDHPGDAEARAKVGLVLFEMGAAKAKAGKSDDAAAFYRQAAKYLQAASEAGLDGELRSKVNTALNQLRSQGDVVPRTLQAAPASPPER